MSTSDSNDAAMPFQSMLQTGHASLNSQRKNASREPESRPRGSVGYMEPSYDSDDDDDDMMINTHLLRHQRFTQGAVYESLEYDNCENDLFFKQFDESNHRSKVRRYRVLRWVMSFLIGIFTAMVAFFIDYIVKNLIDVKFDTLVKSVNSCMEEGCLALSLLYFILFNAGFVFIATSLTALAPVAAGSGIPEIKCYLNGIRIPGVTDIKTMVAKVVGVLFSVAGGMFVGKEGPMIHSGAIVGAGITQGKSSTFSCFNTGFTWFRNDRAKRDFVSGGAAAGVAAAFGAPIGGVLFSLEEGASFWEQSLTWRTLFCSMSSTFMLNVLVSGFELNRWGDLEAPGLINFGTFENNTWKIPDLLIFVLMGAGGGLLGALFNEINKRITMYRLKHVRGKMQKIAESILIAIVATTVIFILSMTVGVCRPLVGMNHTEPSDNIRTFFCKEGQYNDMATLAFNPQEVTIKQLFHSENSFSLQSLAIYFCMFFCTACWTYGVSIPSGLFVPCIVTGALYGRFLGNVLHNSAPGFFMTSPGTYALIGAAAFLGGVVRMTISLTVILMESTNEISLGLPLMVTLMVAKWVGDIFNTGLYDLHIELKHIPLLEWEPSEGVGRYHATDIMSANPLCVRKKETVGSIVHLLKTSQHHAFPVVEPSEDDDSSPAHLLPVGHTGRLLGLIRRSQLIILLLTRTFGEAHALPHIRLSQEAFTSFYPLHETIDNVDLTEEDFPLLVDLEPYMHQNPYTVWQNTSVPRVFNLFRTMGLRHLPVLDRSGVVVGIITRKDLVQACHEHEHED